MYNELVLSKFLQEIDVKLESNTLVHYILGELSVHVLAIITGNFSSWIIYLESKFVDSILIWRVAYFCVWVLEIVGRIWWVNSVRLKFCGFGKMYVYKHLARSWNLQISPYEFVIGWNICTCIDLLKHGFQCQLSKMFCWEFVNVWNIVENRSSVKMSNFTVCCRDWQLKIVNFIGLLWFCQKYVFQTCTVPMLCLCVNLCLYFFNKIYKSR